MVKRWFMSYLVTVYSSSICKEDPYKMKVGSHCYQGNETPLQKCKRWESTEPYCKYTLLSFTEVGPEFPEMDTLIDIWVD